MRRVGADPELFDHPRQAGRLAGLQVEHQASHGGGVDDRVLERPLQTPTHEIGVESIMTVLDQDGAAGEAEEGRARVGERGRAHEHRAVDLMALLGVAIDGRPAVDQGVVQGERAAQAEALGTDLDDQERTIARRLDVKGDVVGVLEPRVRRHRIPLDDQLLEKDRLPVARLQAYG